MPISVVPKRATPKSAVPMSVVPMSVVPMCVVSNLGLRTKGTLSQRYGCKRETWHRAAGTHLQRLCAVGSTRRPSMMKLSEPVSHGAPQVRGVKRADERHDARQGAHRLGASMSAPTWCSEQLARSCAEVALATARSKPKRIVRGDHDHWCAAPLPAHT